MLGDPAGMAEARRRAAAAVGKLTPAAATIGVYSIPRADDPPEHGDVFPAGEEIPGCGRDNSAPDRDGVQPVVRDAGESAD